MFVENCNECEHTNNCRSFYGWFGCKNREDILKYYDDEQNKKKVVPINTACSE